MSLTCLVLSQISRVLTVIYLLFLSLLRVPFDYLIYGFDEWSHIIAFAFSVMEHDDVLNRQ